MDDFLTWSI